MPEVADTCSLASPASVCRTQHLHLRCSVDFDRRALTGTAALTVQSQEDNLRSLVRGRLCSAASPGPLSSPLLAPARREPRDRWLSLRGPSSGSCTSLSAPTLIPSSAPLSHLYSYASPFTYDGLLPLPVFLDTS